MVVQFEGTLGFLDQVTRTRLVNRKMWEADVGGGLLAGEFPKTEHQPLTGLFGAQHQDIGLKDLGEAGRALRQGSAAYPEGYPERGLAASQPKRGEAMRRPGRLVMENRKR